MIIVDRFEQGIAVLETDNGMIEVEKTIIDDDVCEGDVVLEKDGIYSKDEIATKERREKIIALRNKILKR